VGQLYQLWKADVDPDDPVNGYVPYSFIPTGHAGIANMTMTRDFARRESVMVIPGMDGVLDGYGRIPGPMDRRDQSFTFRVFTSDGNLDAAYDLLAAQVAPGYPQRLVYLTDSGTQWFTVGSNPRIQHTLTAANNWGHGGYCDFTVTWRIRPDWRPRYSEASQVFHSVTSFAASTTFGSLGATTIASTSQPFSVDARGTAGTDLPTLPDSGATITLTGPCGGANGLLVLNYSATAYDSAGTAQPLYFIIPFNLPTSHDSCSLKFASQTFLHNGVPFRPQKPLDGAGLSYQREWFRIEPGILNSCHVNALGASPLVGGKITVDFWRKRA
jgi:hypothetical protein